MVAKTNKKTLKRVLMCLLFLGVVFTAVNSSFAVDANTSSVNISNNGNSSELTYHNNMELAENDPINNRTNVNYVTIQDAINGAQSGDTILIGPGTYKENVNIDKNINLIGPYLSGHDPPVIDGQHKDSSIKITNGAKVMIEGITIINGRGKDGGLEEIYQKYSGGGIYINNGDLTIKNCTIADNGFVDPTQFSGNYYRTYGGGIYNTGSGSLTVDKCTFTGNHAYQSGGAIYSDSSGSLTVNNCIFTTNFAIRRGNGLLWDDASLIYYEEGTGLWELPKGGAIYHKGGGDFSVKNTTFNSNIASYGGAIYNTDGKLTLESNTFKFNIVTHYRYNKNQVLVQEDFIYGGYGGALYNNNGNLMVTNNDFVGNLATYGGAISNKGSKLNVINSNFQLNRAVSSAKLQKYTFLGSFQNYFLGGFGGAINNENGNLTGGSNTFDDNTAIYGGAIFSKGDCTVNVTSSTFRGNKAVAVDQNGNTLEVVTYDVTKVISTVIKTATDSLAFLGFSKPLDMFKIPGTVEGIVNDVNKVIEQSKNIEEREKIQATGGAICIEDECRLILSDTTLTNNTASLGGALNNNGKGAITVTNSTFKFNKAGFGGAISCEQLGKLNITNSYLESNLAQAGGGAVFYAGDKNSEYGDINIQGNIFKDNNAAIGDAVYNTFNGTTFAHINYNKIIGTGNFSIFNQGGKNLDAQYNWWGTNKPNPYVSSDYSIIYNPWIILTVTANPAQPQIPRNVVYNDSITVSADFLHDSTYDISDPDKSKIDPVNVKVMDNIPVTFTLENGGVINPVTVTTLNGKATTTYIANGTIDTNELVKIYATAENIQKGTVSTLIQVTKIPTLTSIIKYSDGTIWVKVIDNRVNDTNYYGRPITEGKIQLVIPNTYDGLLSLDANGTIRYSGNLPNGQYTIKANYLGTAKYAPSQDTLMGNLNLMGNHNLLGSSQSKQFYTFIRPSENQVIGDIFSYIITVGNGGPNTISNAVLTYFIPNGYEFVRASVNAGSYTYDTSSRVLTWNLGDVSPGDHFMWLDLRKKTPLTSPVFGSPTELKEKQIKAQNRTVSMQKTGTPIIGLLLAFLMVLGGLFRSRKE